MAARVITESRGFTNQAYPYVDYVNFKAIIDIVNITF
jgi:hypothetical protein